MSSVDCVVGAVTAAGFGRRETTKGTGRGRG